MHCPGLRSCIQEASNDGVGSVPLLSGVWWLDGMGGMRRYPFTCSIPAYLSCLALECYYFTMNLSCLRICRYEPYNSLFVLSCKRSSDDRRYGQTGDEDRTIQWC
jgi:hypothetical protein